MVRILKKLILIVFLSFSEIIIINASSCEYYSRVYNEFAEACRIKQVEYAYCDLEIYIEPITNQDDSNSVTFVCKSHKDSECRFSYSSYLGFYIPQSCLEQTNPIVANGIEIKNQSPVTFCGSIIEPSNQVLGEIINLNNLNFDLVYFTSRSAGKKSDYEIKFNIPNNSNSNDISLSFLEGEAPILTNTYPGGTAFSYIWNGQDKEGKETWGGRKIFLTHKELKNNQTILEKKYEILVGNFKAKKLGLGGWVPSIWHFYDDVVKRIYLGNGASRNVEAVKEGAYFRVADELGREVYYFDELGRIVETRLGLTGSILYKFVYDTESGFLKKITDSYQKNTLFMYGNNKLKKIIGSNGVEIKIQLDENNNLVSLIKPKNEIYEMTYEQNSHLLRSFKKPNGLISTFTYDNLGNLIQDTNNSGQSSLLTKTSDGIKATSAIGRNTHYNYDSKANKENVVTPSGLTTTYVNSPTESNISNSISTLKKQINNDDRFSGQAKYYSNISINNFGERNIKENRTFRLIDNTNPFSIQTFSREITEGDSRVLHSYDGITRLHKFETIEGRFSTSQIDSLERPILMQTGNLLPVKFTYDQKNLMSISQGDRKTKFSYDSNNDLLKTITNNESHSKHFFYDEANRLSSIKIEDGRIVGLKYDSNNNLVSVSPPGRPNHQIGFGLNELVASYNPPSLEGLTSVNTTYHYNNDRDLIKIKRPDGLEINLNWNQNTGLLDSISGAFGSIARQYQNEQLAKIINYDGQIANFSYMGTVVTEMNILDSNQSEIYSFKRSPSTKFPGLVGLESLEVKSVTKLINYDYNKDKFLTKAGDLN